MRLAGELALPTGAGGGVAFDMPVDGGRSAS
jgi:hypothetical protein